MFRAFSYVMLISRRSKTFGAWKTDAWVLMCESRDIDDSYLVVSQYMERSVYCSCMMVKTDL